MAVLTGYKGLDVVEGASGAGGAALTDNFKELADRAPYEAASNPGVNDDSGDGFAAGDRWLNTSTQTMWACVSASAGAAVWKSLYVRTSTALELIPQETGETVRVLGSARVDGNLGVGTSSPQAKLHGTASTILGSANSAVSDGNIGNSQLNVWLDESNSLLKLKSKTSGGTVNTAELPLGLTALSGITAGTISASKAAIVDSNKDLVGFRNLGLTGTSRISSGGVTELYNTVDQTTNYERLAGFYSSNVAYIGHFYGGTGTSTRRLAIGTSTLAGATTLAGNARVLNISTNATSLSQGIFDFGAVTGGTNIAIVSMGGIGLTASSGIQAVLSVAPVVGQSGTGGYTALLVNPSETSTGSGNKLLADFQVGGSSKVSIDNTGLMTIATDQVRVTSSKTPSSASDTGVTGAICWDSSYVYVCVATNTWKRSALSTW